jgi:hypothetical protein
MKELFKQNRVNYILRTYLPTWNYEQRIEEIVRFCKETDTCYVMLFTDAQHIVWNQLTLDEARHEADNILEAKNRLLKDGIRLGINSSYNMPQSRWDQRNHNDYDFWATYADGSCEYRTPCLLDPKLEEYLNSYYSILAEVGADYIHIDDDHRYVMMGQKNTWGCFCELHLRKFGDVTGRTWTRLELNKALLEDQQIRVQWIDFLGERLVEIAKIISSSVHRVNPEIEVGMMVPCVHPLPAMGHTVKNMMKAFSPEGIPLVRPCIGPYSDHDRRQIIPGLFYLEFIGYLLGDNAVYTPEIETTPFSRFSKSMTTVRFHITQCLLNRMNNPAISLCGYSGDSPYFEPAFVDLLARSRGFFEGVRANAPGRGSRKGIQLMWDFNAPKASTRAVDSVTDFYWPSFVVHDILGNSGFPCTYDESPVKFLVGDTAYALTEEHISELLKSNLVLDATAARALAKRGFAEQIGCCVGDAVKEFAAEECIDEKYFGQYAGAYIPLKGVPLKSVLTLKPSNDAVEISQIVNHDLKKIAPGVILFKNASGGKIATLPYAIGPTDSDLRHFICYQRQFMFRRIFDWMNPESVPVFVEHPSDFAVQCWDDGKRLMCCITNLSYDDAEHIVIKFNAGTLNIANAFYIAADGSVKPLSPFVEDLSSPGETRWRIKNNFHIFTPFIIIMNKGQ